MAQARKLHSQLVLEAAIDLLEKKGRDAVSLRTIARLLGVKAPSLYRYFGDKAALEAAIVEEGNRLLLEATRSALGRKKRRPAFASVAVAYLEFARKRPVLYAFMMEGRDVPVAASTAGKQLWKLLLGVVAGVSGNLDNTSAAVAVWSFLHGFASLEQAGRFGKAGPQKGFEVGLEALAAGAP